MADISADTARLERIQSDYMALARQKRVYSFVLLIIFIALMVAGFSVAESRNAGSFWGGIDNFFDYPGELVSEAAGKLTEFPAHFVRFLPALIETVNIAGAATLLGALVAIVLSLLSTRGMARWPALIPLFRRIMDVTRAIPEIVVALMLIFVLGGGPVPAMIAIALHTAGALGKLFSEVNENADLKPIDGLTSVGANWSQQMALGVVPQVAPNWLSYALLRFEINVRASAILGFVGAGGLGYELKNAISWGQGRYDEAAAIFLMLFVTIIAIDQVSSHYRDRLTHGSSKERRAS